MIDIDYEAAKAIDAQVEAVRKAGLGEAADMFSTVYWAWLRTMSAYVAGHPYVGAPEDGMTPLSALHVTDTTIAHWAPKIPGTPMIDDQAVLDDAAADAAWHREEDRRMRRAAGEEI